MVELVLQNRRGLNLLFLKDGGLYMALWGTCFYVNHSGIVRDTLAKIKQNLMDREEQRRQACNWFQSLFYFIFSFQPEFSLSPLLPPYFIFSPPPIHSSQWVRALMGNQQSQISLVPLANHLAHCLSETTGSPSSASHRA